MADIKLLKSRGNGTANSQGLDNVLPSTNGLTITPIDIGNITPINNNIIPNADIFGNKALNTKLFAAAHNGLTPAQFGSNAEGVYNNGYINKELNSYFNNKYSTASTGGTGGTGNHFYDNWGYKQWGTAASAGLGLGQLGLGIANYMTQKKVANKQMRALDQQYASNADLISHRKSHRASIEKAFANNASNFA